MDKIKIFISGIAFQNPVWLASGTCGYGLDMEELLDLDAVGAVCTKGLSLSPCKGNPPPRMVETPCGALNAIGLENIGVEAFLRDKLPRLRRYKAKIVANIWGATLDEYVSVSKALDPALSGGEGVAMLELNVSCPNVKKGGMEFGNDPVLLQDLTRAVTEAVRLPVMVKLSPNVTDIVKTAKAAVAGGAQALSLINTLSAMVIDTKTRKPALANVFGGLSGPAVRPVAVRMVYQVAQAVHVPVVGVGGIASLNDALEFFMAGASAVQVGTMNFVEPGFAERLAKELRGWCEREGVKELSEIVGCVHDI